MPTQLTAGKKAVPFNVTSVLNTPLSLETLRGKKVFLAFMRNTQCPICSLYVYQLLKLTETLRQHNTEVVLFYESSTENILRNPFFKDKILNEKNLYVVSDPKRVVYSLYGTEISPEKATMEALVAGNKIKFVEEAIQLGFNGNGQEEGTNPAAIPAEFFINERAEIVRAHYGADAADHVSLQALEEFAVKVA